MKRSIVAVVTALVVSIAVGAAQPPPKQPSSPGKNVQGSNARLFLVPALVQLEEAVVVGGGVTQTFEVFLENTAPDNSLRGYQVVLNDGTGGTTGTVDYEPVYKCNGQNSPPDLGMVCTPGPTACSSNPADCDLVTARIDTNHANYVFASATSQKGTVVDPGPPTRLANAVADAVADSVPVTTAVYLGDITYSISSDATGTFNIDFIDPGSQVGVSQTILANVSSALFPFTAEGAVINIGAGCTVAAECFDTDANNARDDNCVWSQCTGNTCSNIDIIFADAGGAFGACLVDGFCNIHDRTHALLCFAGTNPCSPFASDVGGAFGACPQDGFCNIHDATHALRCFAGTNPCSCGPGPASQAGPVVVGGATLTAVADRRIARPGDEIAIRLYLNDAQADLQGYQLHLQSSGGRSGALQLLDISIEEGASGRAFDASEPNYQAFNIRTGQMLNGLDGGGVATGPKAYLATFTYRASRDAAGTFLVDVLHDEAAGDQTFLISNFTKEIEVTGSTPAVVEIRSAR